MKAIYRIALTVGMVAFLLSATPAEAIDGWFYNLRFNTKAEGKNREKITNSTDGMLDFTGVGGGDNTDIRFDLDGTYPVCSSVTDSKIGIDDDLEFVGAQTISTSSGNLTIDAAGTTVFADPISLTGATLTQQSTAPRVLLYNTTHEDGSGGRESYLHFRGEQSGGEISELARIEVSHDGAADDQKGKIIFKVNDGSDDYAPTQVCEFGSDLLATFAGAVTVAGNITMANAEVISNDDGYIQFTGSGGSNDASIRVDLDNAAGPILESPSDTAILCDEDFTFVGPQTLGTDSGNLTIDSAATTVLADVLSMTGATQQVQNTAPRVVLYNTTEEDGDGGRESYIQVRGEQSGGEISELAKIEISHDGAADDQKGKVVISVNDGADDYTPTQALEIGSDLLATFAGAVSVGGNLSVTGTFSAKRTIQMELHSWQLDGSPASPTTFSTTPNRGAVGNFDMLEWATGETTQKITRNIAVPYDYSSAMIFHVMMVADGAAAGSADTVGLDWYNAKSTEASNPSVNDEAAVTVAPGTVLTQYDIAMDAGAIEVGDIIRLVFGFDATDQTIDLVNAWITYTADVAAD